MLQYVEPIRVFCDQQQCPELWFGAIFDAVPETRLCEVMFNLFTAKLRVSHQEPRECFHRKEPMFTGTRRILRLGEVLYCLTDNPDVLELRKFKAMLRREQVPVLLVPRATLPRAQSVSERAGMNRIITIFSVESFLGLSVLHLVMKRHESAWDVLKLIIGEYNHRVGEIEKDNSLMIDIQ